MAASSTRIVVVSSDTDYTIPGDLTPQEVINLYSSQLPGIGSMTSTVTMEGNTKVITFSPRTGTKG